MGRSILIKKSFNAGEFSPELWYRDDLEKQAKACKHLENFTATPYGAVARRPPMGLLASFDTAFYGVPIKYIPFKFSLTEVFHFVFTDGTGSAGLNPDTADLMIFDSEGNIVVLDGTVPDVSFLPVTLPEELSTGIVTLIDTIYKQDDLNNLHFINVNDFVYLTCGGDYPVQSVNRFFDKIEQDNRWKIKPLEITGLLGDVNHITEQSVYIDADGYDSATTYAENDIVGVGSDDISITATGWTFKAAINAFRHSYYMTVTLASGSYTVGEVINIDGLTITSVDSRNIIYWGTTLDELVVVGSHVSGAFDIIAVDGLTLTINKFASAGNTLKAGDYPTVDFSGATGSVISAASGVAFFRSLADGNTNNSVDDEDFWAGIPYFMGELNVIASDDIFAESDVGREIAIKPQGSQSLSDAWDSDQTSEAINAYGTVELITEGGVWSGTLTLQASTNAGATWDDLKSITSNDGSSNSSVEVDIVEIETIIRVVFDFETGTDLTKCKWRVELKGAVSNHARISTFIDARNVTVQTINPFLSGVSDYRYSLGEFSETTGYPYTLSINDERLCLGGSREKPNTVFASRVNDWGNYLKGVLDTSPYTFTVASDSFDTIRSLKSSRQLNILTDNQEVTMGTRDDNQITSISNIAVSSHTNYGSSNVQAVKMADMIWFTMGQSRRVRASRYDFASDGQQSTEMSLFASHITESGIKEMSFRRHPFNSLFCVLENGKACSLTYEKEQDISAWSKITTNGSIISAYSNYSDTGDVVVGIVKRGDSYYLEEFGSITENTVYLDNFKTYVDQDFDSGIALDQLEFNDLCVVHDDVELVPDTDYTIVAGVLTIPSVTTGNVTVGLKFESRINPTDVTDLSPDGAFKRLTKLSLYLLNSGDCKVKVNGRDSKFTDGLNLQPTERLEGVFDMSTKGGFDGGLDIDITVNSHKPFTLTGLGYRIGL